MGRLRVTHTQYLIGAECVLPFAYVRIFLLGALVEEYFDLIPNIYLSMSNFSRESRFSHIRLPVWWCKNIPNFFLSSLRVVRTYKNSTEEKR